MEVSLYHCVSLCVLTHYLVIRRPMHYDYYRPDGLVGKTSVCRSVIVGSSILLGLVFVLWVCVCVCLFLWRQACFVIQHVLFLSRSVENSVKLGPNI